ncbi:MAG: flavodoxin [Lachnospiraceae bacterium]|jgi:flavodoxin|nr:flavodoxin [Lachnospiraceae bacterium]
MSRKLVAYFSASGITASAAEKLADAIHSDLYEIVPEELYTKADLDWTDHQSRSTKEMKNLSFRPALKKKDAGIDSYDAVFVGFPIWWGIAPTLINTFLESYDFSGKTVIPFATSGGSGMGKTDAGLKPSCSKDTKWKQGKLLNGLSKERMAAWAESLDL